MDALVEYGDAIRRNMDRVQAVRADQLAGPTPCRDWDVTALLTHLIGGHEMFAAALGQPAPPVDAADDPSVTVLATRYRTAAAASLDAFAAPGALQRVVGLPIGEVPGEVALGMALTDAVVHGWDLAVATGQDATIDDRVAGPLLAGAQAAITDDLRQPAGARAVFAQPVPVDPDSPAGERLVAFLGRSPQFR
jgi:uncharacterized protein (TIGR03086 family)